jgi:hypothetical protein
MGDGHVVYIHALRATAEYFGWDKAFDPSRSEVLLPPKPGGLYRVCVTRRTGAVGGRRLQISRTATKSNKAGTRVNVFRISKSARHKDLLAVARATQGEWRWMTNLKGARCTYEELLHPV